ncbi:MAG: SRPBCC domain-containing protein [Inquilinaceae bacterium]
MTIHQETSFQADAKRVYGVLTDGAEFAKATGAPASMDATPGGAFSFFGDQITGRFLEVEPGARIVQAWRVAAWDPGVYSVVRFTIGSHGGKTTLVIDQDGYPEAAKDHLEAGWHKMYWDPIKAHL